MTIFNHRSRFAAFIIGSLAGVILLAGVGDASAFTCTAQAGGGNWNAGGTWTACNGTFPQAGDDVLFKNTSGNVVVNVDTNNLNSLDMTGGTGYTGTLSGSNAITVAPASGSTVVKVKGTITWTGALNLNPANGATVTLSSNGKTLNDVTINGGATGVTILAQALTIGATNTFTLTQGVLHTDGAADNSGLTHSWGIFNSNNSNTRTLNLGTSNVNISDNSNGTVAWQAGNSSGLTMSANTATITLSGVLADTSSVYFTITGVNFNGASLVMNQGGTIQVNNNSLLTFANVTRSCPAASNCGLSLRNAITATGTFTASGTSAIKRVLLNTWYAGTNVTITAATVTVTNADLMDITGAGAGSWDLSAISGGSGDCGGNSGITFTTAAPQTWSGTAGGNWSANAWSGRVPLPQDDVSLGVTFTTAKTVTADMPRLGHNIDWTGATGTPAWAGTITTSSYGSLTLISGMTVTKSGAHNLYGRATGMPGGGWTINTNGKTLSFTIGLYAYGATYILLNDFKTSSSLYLYNGTLTANNFNVTAGVISNGSSGTATRALNMGSGTWTSTSTGNVWYFTPTGATINSDTSTFVISDAGTLVKNFNGGGFSYNNGTFSGNNIVITDSNSYATFAVNNAGTAAGLALTSGTTQTISSAFTTNGFTNNLAKLSATTPGAPATLSMASGTVSVDYISIQDSAATGGASWNAGSHAINVSGNSGWSFAAYIPPFDALLIGGD